MKQNTTENRFTIKNWADDDKPREKLIAKGKKALSNAELLAIIISSGNVNESALDISKKILDYCDNKLSKLNQLSIKELITNFKGIGNAKAVSIVAALELSNRTLLEPESKDVFINNSICAYRHIINLYDTFEVETFWVLFLNRSNKVIEAIKLSSGGLSSAIVEQRLVIKKAIENNAAGIILSHNHPSGNLEPSSQDKIITQSITKAADMFDIKVIDHIIVKETSLLNDDYFSFADHQLL